MVKFLLTIFFVSAKVDQNFSVRLAIVDGEQSLGEIRKCWPSLEDELSSEVDGGEDEQDESAVKPGQFEKGVEGEE